MNRFQKQINEKGASFHDLNVEHGFIIGARFGASEAVRLLLDDENRERICEYAKKFGSNPTPATIGRWLADEMGLNK